MNLSNFLNEAQRVQPLAKADDTPERKAIREPGDVGMVDRLTQMDRKKPNRKDYSKRSNFIQRTRDPVERMLAQTNPGEEMDPNFDPDAAGYKSHSRSGKQIQQGMTKGYEPGMDAVSAADRRMRDKVFDAQSPTAQDDVQVPGSRGERVTGSGWLRHGYQSSGVGLNKALQQDDLDYLYNAMQDVNPVDKGKGPTSKVQDRGGIEQTRVRTPTARDLEAHSDTAERAGAEQFDRAYLTRDVMRQQKALRDALSGQNAAEVQRLSFRHEVSNEALNNFIEMHGRKSKKFLGKFASKLGKDIEKGGTGGDFKVTSDMPDWMKSIAKGGKVKREQMLYGGDLGPEAEKFRNPDGTYDFTKLKGKLLQQAQENRQRELVRVYLQQGGRDAYAQHEGVRSIKDMDLEHITSLTKGGKDDPSNWVFASGNLNKLRDNRDLPDAVEKYAEGAPTNVVATKRQRQQTLKNFTDSLTSPDDANKVKEILGITDGTFTKKGYGELSDEDIEAKRKKAKTLGMSDEDIETLFPPRLDATQPFDAKGRMPYLAGRDQYDKQVTDEERQSVRMNQLVTRLKEIPGNEGKNEEALLNTPEGIRGMKQIRGETDDALDF